MLNIEKIDNILRARLITGKVHHDHRGYVTVPFIASSMNHLFGSNRPVQQTISKSKKGTVRGFHFSPYWKLVTCVSGEISDYLLQIHVKDGSLCTAYTKAIHLRSPNQYKDEFRAVLIPPGVGHAFLAETKSIVSYVSWGEWDTDREIHCRADFVGIVSSKFERNRSVLMSEKDKNANSLLHLSRDELKAIANYQKL